MERSIFDPTVYGQTVGNGDIIELKLLQESQVVVPLYQVLLSLRMLFLVQEHNDSNTDNLFW